MEYADIVIIGAGFAGASTAFHLARRGCRDIIILEREAIPGRHASGRNAALAFTVLSDPMEARLAVEGAAFLAVPPDGFCATPLLRHCGSLLVATGEGGMALLKAAEEMSRRLGLNCAFITPQEAIAKVPVLEGAPLAGAFWNPHDGIVDIHSLLQSYLAGARQLGVRIRYGTSVRSIRRNGDRITGVVTDAGEIECATLVNAAGGWAGEMGVLAGSGSRTIAPLRRHLFQTVTTQAIDHNWPFVWHYDFDAYFRPEGDGLLMSPCDATAHAAQEPVVDDAAKILLAEKLSAAFPRLADVRIASGWACLRTFASDGRFVIGHDPEIHGLVWVAALGGHGMTTSPAVGRLGAAAVLGEENDELAYFSPRRLVAG